MKKLLKLIHYILSAPKTIYFNMKYFPLKVAIKCPILVSNSVFLETLNGKIAIEDNIRTGMIKIGFSTPGLFDYKRQRSVWSINGTVTFKGSASIGSGSKICIDRKDGKIIFGDNFVITANSQIWSRKKIEFGNNNLISWDNIFMDTDSHSILDIQSDKKINDDREIIIGDNVWIGCRCTILKGSVIGSNTVIAANSVINRNYAKQENIILGGNPVSIKKNNIRWIM